MIFSSLRALNVQIFFKFKMKIFYEDDASVEILSGKTIAVIGFGAQGRAQAKMLQDAGCTVVVGLRPGGASFSKAQSDGMKVLPVAEAAQAADIVHILIPDEIQGKVYREEIAPHMSAGKVLSFSHGLNIVAGKITPPENVDVIMVAPKAPGTEVRKVFKQGFGVPALIAVERDASGKARDIALAMAKAMRFTKAGVIQCSFKEEAFEDLFGEQAVLCGGLAELMKKGFEVLTEAGYPPEVAYFECVHEMKLIVDLVYEKGLAGMWDVVSNTAEFGGRLVGPKVIDDSVKERMRQALKNVESGEFAKTWFAEFENGCPNLEQWRKAEKQHPVEITGEKVRGLFKK